MTHYGWVEVCDRVKYVLVYDHQTMVYITLDGRFHSWASYDYETMWSVRTVKDPQTTTEICMMPDWYHKISEDEK